MQAAGNDAISHVSVSSERSVWKLWNCRIVARLNEQSKFRNFNTYNEKTKQGLELRVFATFLVSAPILG
jgi:hypothetical protein